MQPDSLIPEPQNPQAWNRYSYVSNNPLSFNDPSGHTICTDDGYCGPLQNYNPPDTSSLPGNSNNGGGDGGSNAPCEEDDDMCWLQQGNKENSQPTIPVNPTQGELTDVDKIGVTLTAVVVDGVVILFELSFVGFQIVLLDGGPVGIIIDTVVIAPAELLVGDFGLSFSLMVLQEIDTGQTTNLKWTITPALFSMLPTNIQQNILSNVPAPLYKILTNSEP